MVHVEKEASVVGVRQGCYPVVVVDTPGVESVGVGWSVAKGRRLEPQRVGARSSRILLSRVKSTQTRDTGEYTLPW